MITGILIVAIILVLIYISIEGVLRRERRRKLMEKPFPAQWLPIIERNIALYRHLPDELKPKLQGYMQVLFKEKHFEGCGGLELTEEIIVTIIGEAAILLLGRPDPTFFPKAESILVYPDAYVVQDTSQDGYIVSSGRSVRLGESWQRGLVVLSWEQVRRHAKGGTGHNVVLHEFAHQLDQESGGSSGTPRLEHHSGYQEWARVMNKDYEKLLHKALHHIHDVIDDYGATNPAEFFAVSTETFFEKSRALRHKHPDIYHELNEYYKLDPASWGHG